jgi:hypothetical protein
VDRTKTTVKELLPGQGKFILGFGVGLMSALGPELFSNNPWVIAGGFGFGALCVLGVSLWVAYNLIQRRLDEGRVTKLEARSAKVIVSILAIGLAMGAYKFTRDAILQVDLVYIQAIKLKSPKHKNNFLLVIINLNEYAVTNVKFWISPYEAKLKDGPLYRKIDVIARPNVVTLSQGRTFLRYAVPYGKYYVEWNVNNGKLLQTLELVRGPNGPIQIIEVRNRTTTEVVFSNKIRIGE